MPKIAEITYVNKASPSHSMSKLLRLIKSQIKVVIWMSCWLMSAHFNSACCLHFVVIRYYSETHAQWHVEMFMNIDIMNIKYDRGKNNTCPKCATQNFIAKIIRYTSIYLARVSDSKHWNIIKTLLSPAYSDRRLTRISH